MLQCSNEMCNETFALGPDTIIYTDNQGSHIYHSMICFLLDLMADAPTPDIAKAINVAFTIQGKKDLINALELE